MLSFARWAATAAVLAMAAGIVQAAPRDNSNLDVRLSVPTPVLGRNK